MGCIISPHGLRATPDDWSKGCAGPAVSGVTRDLYIRADARPKDCTGRVQVRPLNTDRVLGWAEAMGWDLNAAVILSSAFHSHLPLSFSVSLSLSLSLSPSLPPSLSLSLSYYLIFYLPLPLPLSLPLSLSLSLSLLAISPSLFLFRSLPGRCRRPRGSLRAPRG